MAHALITLTEETDEETSENNESISLELDNDANAGATEFLPGEVFYVRMYISPKTSYGYDTINGTASGFSEKTAEEIEDFLTFSFSDTGSLKYPDYRSLSYDTKFNNSARVKSVKCGNVILTRKTIGYMRYSMNPKYRLISCVGKAAGKYILFVMTSSGSSASIEVQIKSKDPDDLDDQITLELDSVMNAEKSEFLLGDDVWVRVITNAKNYEVANNMLLRRSGFQDTYDDYETLETIPFINSKRGSFGCISYKKGSPFTSWSGDTGTIRDTKITVIGNEIYLSRAVTKVLEVRYYKKFTRFKVTPTKEGILIFTAATSKGASASLQVQIGPPAGTQRVDWTAVVINARSGDPVPGADVIITGYGTRTTNANGEAFLANIPKGTYQVKIRKTGFVKSEEDDLENDTITIG